MFDSTATRTRQLPFQSSTMAPTGSTSLYPNQLAKLSPSTRQLRQPPCSTSTLAPGLLLPQQAKVACKSFPTAMPSLDGVSSPPCQSIPKTATQSGTPTSEPTGSATTARSNLIGHPHPLTSQLFGVIPKRTAPVPTFTSAGTARLKSLNGGSGPPARRMVPTPRNRQQRRPVSRQYGRHQASPPTCTPRHSTLVGKAYPNHSP